MSSPFNNRGEPRGRTTKRRSATLLAAAALTTTGLAAATTTATTVTPAHASSSNATGGTTHNDQTLHTFVRKNEPATFTVELNEPSPYSYAHKIRIRNASDAPATSNTWSGTPIESQSHRFDWVAKVTKPNGANRLGTQNQNGKQVMRSAPLDNEEFNATGAANPPYKTFVENPIGKALPATALLPNGSTRPLNTSVKVQDEPATPDLRIRKTTDTEGPVAVGDEITFTIEIGNYGNSDATEVTVTDMLPPNLDNIEYGTPSVGAMDGDVWSVGPMAPDAHATVTVTGTVTESDETAVINQAIVDSPDDPHDPDVPCEDNPTLPADSDNCDIVEVPVESDGADVRIVKLTDAEQAVPGEDITWTVQVGNFGDGQATNVVVTDLLPTNTVNGALSDPSKGDVDAAVWNVGTLDPGETAEVTVTATVADDADGPVVNYAIVESPDDPDTPPENPETDCVDNPALPSDDDNCDLVEVPMPDADVRVHKTTDAEQAVPGDEITWTVQVGNFGEGHATNTVVNDLAPANVDNVTLSDPSNGDVDGLTWNVGTLDPGETQTVTVTGTVADNATGSIINHATVTSPEDPDTPPENPETDCVENDDVESDDDNCDVVETPIPGPDLKILKVLAGNEKPKAGEPTEWRVDIANAGDGVATDVVVDDIGDDKITDLELVDPTVGSVAGLTWNVGDMQAGDEASITVRGVVAKNASDTVRNVATVDSPEDPHDPDVPCEDNTDLPGDTDNCDYVDTPLDSPDLRIDKQTVSVEVHGDTGTVTWVTQVRNDGPGIARKVVMSDLYPKGTNKDEVRIVDGPSKGEMNVRAGTWNIGRMPAGEVVEVRLATTHKVADLRQGVTNTANVDSPDDPHNPDTPCQENDGLDDDTDNCDFVSVDVPSENTNPPGPGNPIPGLGGPMGWSLIAGVLALLGGFAALFIARLRKGQVEG